jgi:ribonucleotide reductase beta subunit family protein with ferritin-like domain
MSVFEKTLHIDPQYQHLEKYVHIMYRGFWTPAKYEKLIKEVDAPHFFNVLGEVDQEVIRRCIMAVNLVEDKVKTYWSTLALDLPQTIIGDVGGLFGQSEVTHRRSYHSLADILQVNNEDYKNHKALKGRIEYLTKYIEKDPKIIGKKRILKKLVLFTSLVERCSLFTQFYILMSYAKHNKGLKTISSLQQSTAIEECYVEGTEILTPEGWRDILEVKKGDIVYQWNGGRLEKTPTLHVTSRQYSGSVIKFHKQSHQCIVTPNHNMVSFRNGQRVDELAKDFGVNNPYRYIADSFPYSEDKGGKLSDLERLCVALQADGSKLFWYDINGNKLERGKESGFNYVISLKKKRKIERLRQILDSTNIEYKESTNKRGYHNFSLKMGNDVNYKDFSWIDMGKVDKSWAEDFCQELSEWDGYKVDGVSSLIGYSSTNKKCIDVAQHIGIIAGYRTNISVRKDNRKTTYKDTYKLAFSKSDGFKRAHSLRKEWVDYEGRVGCVTVPSGVIMTRYKDKTFVSGNCTHYDFGVDIINIIKTQHPQLWDEYFVELVTDNIKVAYQSELNLIDWFFEKGVPSHLTKEEVVNFLNYNFNIVAKDLCLNISYDVDNTLFKNKNEWFKVKVFMTTEPDFFDMPPSGYASDDEEVNLDNFQF